MSNLFELFKQVSEKSKQIDTYMTFAEKKTVLQMKPKNQTEFLRIKYYSVQLLIQIFT